MALAPPLDPSRLYLATGDDVNPRRPWFTGDVWSSVSIAGVGTQLGILIAHPCSIRGKNGSISERLLFAAVEKHRKVPDAHWESGYYSRMPLKGLPLSDEFHAVNFDLVGNVAKAELTKGNRIACLHHPGINQMQQRLVFHLTRMEIPTLYFQAAFRHTYWEADLLEEWATELNSVHPDPYKTFDEWIRGGDPVRQARLQDDEQVAPIWTEMRIAIRSERAKSSAH